MTPLVSVLVCENKMWRFLISYWCLWHAASAQQQIYTSASSTYGPSNNFCFNVQCPNPPTSCKEVQSSEPRQKAILYNGAEILCDTETDGGGWAIIQKPYDGSLSFSRDWNEYEYGFGSLDKEFWLGLRLMHEWTYKRCYELRVDMQFNGSSHYASYSYFKVNGANDNYRMRIGAYNGTAGDSFRRQDGMQFSTKDKDNDIRENDYGCAVQYSAGWWFETCHNSNLNGLYGNKLLALGLTWRTLTGYHDTVSAVEMKIRPC